MHVKPACVDVPLSRVGEAGGERDREGPRQIRESKKPGSDLAVEQPPPLHAVGLHTEILTTIKRECRWSHFSNISRREGWQQAAISFPDGWVIDC